MNWQELQPAGAEADPAAWADGELQASSEPVASAGGLPQGTTDQEMADTAASPTASSCVAGRAELAQAMQADEAAESGVTPAAGAMSVPTSAVQRAVIPMCVC